MRVSAGVPSGGFTVVAGTADLAQCRQQSDDCAQCRRARRGALVVRWTGSRVDGWTRLVVQGNCTQGPGSTGVGWRGGLLACWAGEPSTG